MKGPTASGTSSAAASRDAGLDFLRAFALVIMVLIHYSRFIKGGGQAVGTFKFLCEAAPAYFFFAFGMTFKSFLEKSGPIKVRRLILFLYIALAHNLYFGSLLKYDFFGFLWLWLLILSVLEWKKQVPTYVYLALFFALIASLSALGPKAVSELFMTDARNFPLLPWGAFVILGLVYRRLDKGWARAALFISIAALSALAMALLGRIYDPRLALTKIPLSAPYILMFSAACISLYELVNGLDWLYKKVPVLPGLFEFISRNLLVATTIHYFAFLPMRWFVLRIQAGRAHPPLLPPLKGFEADYILIGSVLTLALAIALLWITLRAWDKIGSTGLFTRLRNNLDVVALLVILALSSLVKVQAMIGAGKFNELFGLAWSPHVQRAIGYGVFVLILLALNYFALELRHYRRGLPTNGGESP